MNSLTVEEEAIQTILSRAEKGRNEYGEGLHEAEKPIDEWMTFIIEEMIDSALYLMKARRRLNELIAAHVADKAQEDDDLTTLGKAIKAITEPEIKMPKVGEVWTSEFGATAKISEIDGKGHVRYFWTSASKEVQSWCDVPLDNFLSNYTFGRS